MKHHHLNERARKSQSEKVRSLISTLNDVEFDMGAVINKRFYNIVSGRVFPENINMNILNVENIGTESLNTFEKERLSRNSKEDIYYPLKKINLKLFRTANIVKIKHQDNVVELSQHCNLFAKCAVICKSRDIDLKEIVGNFELTSFPRSFFKSNGEQHDGGEGNGQLVKEIRDYVKNSFFDINNREGFDVVVIDAMMILQKLKKTSDTKTVDDLSKLFNSSIERVSLGSQMVIVAFDKYIESSQKSKTRALRNGKVVPVEFEVLGNRNIENVSLKLLLSHIKTKTSLTAFLASKLENYFRERDNNFIISVDNRTVYS